MLDMKHPLKESCGLIRSRPSLVVMAAFAVCFGVCTVLVHPSRVSRIVVSIKRCLFDYSLWAVLRTNQMRQSTTVNSYIQITPVTYNSWFYGPELPVNLICTYFHKLCNNPILKVICAGINKDLFSFVWICICRCLVVCFLLFPHIFSEKGWFVHSACSFCI